MYLLLILCVLPFATPSPARYLHEQRNIEGRSATHPLPRQDPNSDPYADPSYTPNPDWSSDLRNLAPISLDPISPLNDNGRSQMVDNFLPLQISYPERELNCDRRQREFHCSRTLSLTATPPPVLQPTPQPAGVDVWNVITCQQASEIPITSRHQLPPCPFQDCSGEGASCDPGAMRQKDYCACTPGKKDQPFGLKGWTGLRGWTRPKASKVFVNPGVPCETLCDIIFCDVGIGLGCEGLSTLESGRVNDTLSDLIAAQVATTRVTSVSQSCVVHSTSPSTLQDSIATLKSASQDQAFSTMRSVPIRSASQVGFVLPHSTGSSVLPTRSAVYDDISLPVVPGGMGAIHKPGIPEARTEASADYVARVADLERTGENV